MDTTEFRIVRAGEAERADVLALLAEYLPGTDNVGRHQWLYENNPHGRSITVVAYDVQTAMPAGITSVFPRRVKVGRRVRLGSIGGDGYVRPAFRRRGLATSLHRACLDQMRADGVDFMYGPPEPINLRALLRAGSRLVTRVRRFAAPSAIARIVQRLVRSRPRLEPIVGRDPRVARIWDKAAELATVLPVRDPDYYAWRFGPTPSGVQRAFVVVDGGQPLGLCALERCGDRVAIVDLFGPSSECARIARAIAAACSTLAPAVRSFEVGLNDRGPAVGTLWEAGLVRREAKGFQVFAPPGHPDSDTLFDAQSWHYTWGDGDVDRVL